MYLTQSLHRYADIYPHRIASIHKDRRYTWREYRYRLACLAGALQGLGVKSGDRVAILSLNSDRYLEYEMAVVWAGAVMVTMNIRWSVPENIYSLDDSGAEILVVDDAFMDAAQTIRAQAKTLREVIFAGDGPTPEGMLDYETLVANAKPVDDAIRKGDDLAGIFYTSGTTGFPKGVMLSHWNLWTNALATMHEVYLQEDSVYLHAIRWARSSCAARL